ncbi:MAG: phosphosulfolactate synthase [Solirubrobacteraceae bacterium]
MSGEHTLGSLRANPRGRDSGLTEIRGPYYSSFGPGYLDDLLGVFGKFVDWVKLPGPAVLLLDDDAVRRYVEVCHRHEVKVSAGGAIEWVLTRGAEAVELYFDAISALEYDVVEVSAGMLALGDGDYMRLIERAKRTGLHVKAEVGIQFGAGGTSSAQELERAGTGSVSAALARARRALEAGADTIILESEGVTESVTQWRTDVPAAFADALGLERLMFEAAEPAVFEWYVKNMGPEVNLFIDHSQALHLESLRSGVWGPNDLWGRVATYKG